MLQSGRANVFKPSVLYDAVKSGDKTQLINVIRSSAPTDVKMHAFDAFGVACDYNNHEAAQVLCDFWSELSTLRTLRYGMFSQTTWSDAQKAMYRCKEPAFVNCLITHVHDSWEMNSQQVVTEFFHASYWVNWSGVTTYSQAALWSAVPSDIRGLLLVGRNPYDDYVDEELAEAAKLMQRIVGGESELVQESWWSGIKMYA